VGDFHLLLFAGFDRRTEIQEKRCTQSSSLWLPGLQTVVAFGPVDETGNQPAGDENTNDNKAEVDQVVVQIADNTPETALEPELAADQP